MTTDLVTQELAPTSTLFGTDNPAEALAQMTAVAATLADVVRSQHLVVRIQQSEHVRVEGWTFLGSLLGVFPVVMWTHPLHALDEGGPTRPVIGWEARVEARTRSGEVVGAAESECLRSERSWAARDDYALRSMAQTRAVSKALRLPLGFVMQLAGFNPTPAEEMPTIEASGGKPNAAHTPHVEPQASDHGAAGDTEGPVPQDVSGDPAFPPVDMWDPDIPFGDSPPPAVRYITEKQRTRLFTIASKAGVPEEAVRGIVRDVTGQESTKLIPAGKVYDAVVTAIQAAGS
jgi:hypothetical protein